MERDLAVAEPAGPPPLPSELEVYDPRERPDDALRGLRQDGDPLRSSSVAAVRSGRRLARIEAERLYVGWGAGSLEDFVEREHAARRLTYGWLQARKYLRLVRLPLPALVGTFFSLALLRALAIRQDRGEDPVPLIDALKEGRGLPGRRAGKRGDKPSQLGQALARDLARASARLAQLADKLGAEGLGGRHGWEEELGERMRALALAYAELRGAQPAELWTERREAARATPLGEAERGALAGSAEEAAPALGPADGKKLASSAGEKGLEDASLHPNSGGAAAAEAEAPAEPWHVPVARAVMAALSEEEAAALGRQLLLVLSGAPPGDLVATLRGVAGRLPAAALRQDLDLLLRHLAARDLEARWPYAYNLFVTAQPPGFRLHLHCLRTVALPEGLRAVLKAAWACFPLVGDAPADAALPPVVVQAERRVRAFLREGGEASAEAQSWAFCEASDLRSEIDALLREAGGA